MRGLPFPGLAYTLFPYAGMDRITTWDAAAYPSAGVRAGRHEHLAVFIVGYTIWLATFFSQPVLRNVAN